MKKLSSLFIALFVIVSMMTGCSVSRNASLGSDTPPDSTEENSSAISNITSVAGVPILTLNNGVKIPQLGLGTQIQHLEGDSSESGRYFNINYSQMGGFFTNLIN